MELAAALHHSSFPGAGPETYDAPRSQMTANSREDSVYFDLYDEDTEGARPDRLFGVRPQERDQRHTVEQIVDTVLFVPSLDVPVPQMENQLVEVCRQPDVRIPEQVIEVRKISSPSRHCPRRVRFAEQTAEQLVEVPTIISYSSLLQRTVEQNVVIPVPDRGGRNVGLQGFSPRQSSTAQLASQKRSSERIVEQIVDSRVLGGGLQDFRPVQGSSASSSSSREHAGEGVFRTFPELKKSPKLGSHSLSELLPESSPSTLNPHQMAPPDERTSMVDANGHAWVRLNTAEPGYWASTVAPALGALRCLRSSSSTSWWWRLSWSTSSCASPRRLLEFCLFLWVARALRTWKMVHCPPAPCFWQPFLGVWVLLVDYTGLLDSSGDDFVRGAMLGLTLDTGLVTVLGFWKNFTYFLRRRGLRFWRCFSC